MLVEILTPCFLNLPLLRLEEGLYFRTFQMGIRQQTIDDYGAFVEKFKPKKTTDDCYTPPRGI